MARQSATRYENELSNTLEDDYGYASLTAGASGSGIDRERPDVFAARDGHIFAIEVKQAREGTLRFQGHEIPDLLDFAARAGGTAVVAVRPSFQFKRFDSWLVYPADTINETENGHSVRKSDHDRGQSIGEFFGGKR